MFAKLTPAVLMLAVAGLAIPLAGCHDQQTAGMDDSGILRRSYTEPQPWENGNAVAEAQPQARTETREVQTARTESSLPEWPANAVPGECYAKAYIPPALQTVSEQVMIKPAAERLEIVPAQYEWVEERVMTKEASSTLTEVPAEYRTEQVTVQTRPAETGWFVNSGGCKTTDGKTMNNVYCYVTRPAETKTVSKQVIAKSSTVATVDVPAEYTTVKRQKLVAAATTKRIPIPAEFATVEKTIVSAPAHWEWQRVICDHDPVTMNDVKRALIARGYEAGPMNGEMTERDWESVKAFQLANGLGVGNLSHETLNKLQVSSTK